MNWTVVLIALCSFGLPAHALDIYQWVDENGKTHMADVVPEKYRATAKPLGYRKDTVSDAERKDAEAKAAKSKLLLAPPPSPVTAQPAAVTASKPAESARPLTCAQKWDEFYQSRDCFAPYLVRNGTGAMIKPEAYEHCTLRTAPAMECETDKRPVK